LGSLQDQKGGQGGKKKKGWETERKWLLFAPDVATKSAESEKGGRGPPHNRKKDGEKR